MISPKFHDIDIAIDESDNETFSQNFLVWLEIFRKVAVWVAFLGSLLFIFEYYVYKLEVLPTDFGSPTLAGLVAILMLSSTQVFRGPLWFKRPIHLVVLLMSVASYLTDLPMAGLTALILITLVTATEINISKNPRTVFISQLLSVMTAFICLLSMVGFLYGDKKFTDLNSGNAIASVQASILLFCLSLAVLCSRPRLGIMKEVNSIFPGGVMARRLAPTVLLGPIVIGWFMLAAQTQFGFSPQLSITFGVFSTIVTFILFFWFSSKGLNEVASHVHQQKVFLEGITNSIGEGVTVIDNSQRFILFNPAAERLLGKPPPAEQDQDWPNYFGLFHYDQKTLFRPSELPVVRALRGENSDNVEQFIRNQQRPEGLFVNISGRPLLDKDGKRIGGIAVFRDITKQRLYEEKIEKLNLELGRKLQELEIANRELESFSYSASHDLRAPLRGLTGFSKILLDEHARNLDEEAKGLLTRIKKASEKMGVLIDGLLELSRLSRRELKRTRVDLSEIGERITGEIMAQHNSKGVNVSISPNMVCEGDPLLLSLAIRNLLDNAFKYSSKNPNAQIEFGCNHTGDSPSIFFIRDNGAGFEMIYADKLFKPFQRLHSPYEFEGTGIGLATVQRIIQRHGGKIWTEARLDQGATFYFTL